MQLARSAIRFLATDSSYTAPHTVHYREAAGRPETEQNSIKTIYLLESRQRRHQPEGWNSYSSSLYAWRLWSISSRQFSRPIGSAAEPNKIIGLKCRSLVYTDFSYLYSGPLGPVFKAKRTHDGMTVLLRTISLSETHRLLWPSYRDAASHCLHYHHPSIAVTSAVYLDEQGHRFLTEFSDPSVFTEFPLQLLCEANTKPLNMYIAWDIIRQITMVLDWLHNPPPGTQHKPGFHGHLSPANITYCLLTKKATIYDVGFSIVPGPMASMAAESAVQIHDDRFKIGTPADMYALGCIISLLVTHVDKTNSNFLQEMISKEGMSASLQSRSNFVWLYNINVTALYELLLA